MDQANEKKMEAINALSEGNIFCFLIYIKRHNIWCKKRNKPEVSWTFLDIQN